MCSKKRKCIEQYGSQRTISFKKKNMVNFQQLCFNIFSFESYCQFKTNYSRSFSQFGLLNRTWITTLNSKSRSYNQTLRMLVGGLSRKLLSGILLSKKNFSHTPLIKFTHAAGETCDKTKSAPESLAKKEPLSNTKVIKKMTNREALNSAMQQELRRDNKVFLMGEQVAYYHGAYKISKGLIDKFGPQRIWDTPITEAGFTGLGVGAALMGLRPIIEFMTMNFAMQGIDHIINSMAKTHYMSSGILSGSIVFRGLNGPAAAVAAQHSQCFASWFGSIPGLVTLSPYDAEDCRGLLKAAIRGNNPVVFLQNEYLYGEAFDVSQQVLSHEFLIPIGQAKVMRKGKHVTIIGYARNVKFALQAADQLAEKGIEAEVINLRSIKPLDRKTIIQSVKKTHRVVTVEDGFPQSGIGAEIAAVIFQSCFDQLDAPLERVTAIDIPMPYAKNLEELTTPNASHIVKATLKALKGVKL